MVSDEKLISAILTTKTIREASQKSGVSETRIYARLKKETFKKKLSSARKTLLEESSNGLIQHLHSAVDTLGELSRNGKSEQIRLNASESVIRWVLKVNEQLDILNRLERLEDNQNFTEAENDKYK